MTTVSSHPRTKKAQPNGCAFFDNRGLLDPNQILTGLPDWAEA